MMPGTLRKRMRTRGRRKPLRAGAVVVLLTLLLGLFTVLPGGAEAVRRVPYAFCVDDLMHQTNSGFRDSVYIVKDMRAAIGQELTIDGWCCTDEGIDRYEYAWVPATGGPVTWMTPDTMNISPDPGLGKAGIPYPGGYGSARFSLAFSAPAGTSDGYYDVYVRAVTTDNVACDLVILIDLAYGVPDAVSESGLKINMQRLVRDIGDHQAVTAVGKDALCMAPDGMICLGSMDLSAFGAVTVTYDVPEDFVPRDGDRRAILGLKAGVSPLYGQTDGRIPPYRMADGRYDLTGSLAYAALPDTGSRAVTMDLTDCAYAGPVWLTAYLPGSPESGLTVTSVSFTYKNGGFSRSAAKLHFTTDLGSYFNGSNCVDISDVHDEIMGDVLRIRATQDTNDPYISFAAEGCLADHGLRLSADEYKYIVVLARANPANIGNHMTFYLCAGEIGGPTEACTMSTNLINDGKWHYYLLDMTVRDTWRGAIHMWRFDMINGNAAEGNYVDYATVQFFRTREAAEAAITASVTRVSDPFVRGMPDAHPAVENDQSEEQLIGGNTVIYTIPPEDVFIVTLPETEAPTEPPTEPETEPPAEPVTEAPTEAETLPADTEAPGTTDTESQTEGAPSSGCRSAAGLSALLLPLLLVCAAAAIRARRREKQ